MYKAKHTKSKSDTDFNVNKVINDEICGSLKAFQKNLSKEFKSNKQSEKPKRYPVRKFSNFCKKEEDNTFLSSFQKILIFKQQVDQYFFITKLPVMKFNLDNILEIINKKIGELKDNLIKECPILSKSILIEKLNEFIDVIKSLIETKPQEFYKEVKLAIITHFEIIRLEIFELLENLEKDKNEENDSKKDVSEIKKECTFNHGILFNSLNPLSEEFIDSQIDNEKIRKNSRLTSELKDNVISVIIPRKNKILHFIEDVTHEILFSLTNFSYIIDYYSLTISNLNIQLIHSIISYLENNKNKPNTSNSKLYKALFVIELIIILNRTFTKRALKDFKYNPKSSESSLQNTVSKFILNNINELIPKCHGINKGQIFCLCDRYKRNVVLKPYKNILFYKNYLKSYSNVLRKNVLVKSFKFYFELKLIFWKSVYTKIDSNSKNPDICCRICEQLIPLKEFVLHVYYCKEQNNYYKKMINIKSKIRKFINSLEIYRTKINQRVNKDNNFYNKNSEMNKIFKKIKGERNK